MLADEELRRGDPAGALSHLQEIVKKDPSSSSWRVYLFQLLCVLGKWERAATQLSVLQDMDASTGPMVQTYRELLRCEALRAEIFAGRTTPLIFGEPEPWIALLLQAASLDASGRTKEAETLRATAYDDAPARSGTIDDRPFAWIADGDSRLGPLLEAVVLGKYYWIPFARIRELTFEKPADLRDVVWTPASFVWENGGTAVGFVPTRYPGSEESGDGLLALARKTEWRQAGESTWLGLGQRTLATDEGEHALMDVRRIVFDAEAPERNG